MNEGGIHVGKGKICWHIIEPGLKGSEQYILEIRSCFELVTCLTEGDEKLLTPLSLDEVRAEEDVVSVFYEICGQDGIFPCD